MRALGLDLGSRRIGVAIADAGGTVATPLEVIERAGRPAHDHERVAELVAEWEVGIVVVGLPTSLDGTDGPAAIGARAEAAELGSHLSVPVALYDERLTTVVASQQLRSQGVRERDQRGVIDAVAASILLQGWLDHRAAQDRGGSAD